MSYWSSTCKVSQARPNQPHAARIAFSHQSIPFPWVILKAIRVGVQGWSGLQDYNWSSRGQLLSRMQCQSLWTGVKSSYLRYFSNCCPECKHCLAAYTGTTSHSNCHAPLFVWAWVGANYPEILGPRLKLGSYILTLWGPHQDFRAPFELVVHNTSMPFGLVSTQVLLIFPVHAQRSYRSSPQSPWLSTTHVTSC